MGCDDDLTSDVNMDRSISSNMSFDDSSLSHDMSDDGDDYPSDSESANKEVDDSTGHFRSHDAPSAVNESLFKLDNFQDLHFLQQSTFQIKNDNWTHKQLNWNDHVEQLLHEGSFENEYLMSLHSHEKLIRILDPFLMHAKYNSHANEPISGEHIVAVGLRVLSGGRVKDQRDIVETSLDATYKAFDDFVDALNSCLELDIKMPQSPKEWETINCHF